MALVKQILIINIVLTLIIFLLLCSTKTFAGQKKTEQLSCYAEYDSEVYINGQCTLYAEEDFYKQDEFLITLSHNLLCDDGSNDCNYSFQLQQDKYFGKSLHSVYFTSDFNKRATHMQEYLGNNYKVFYWYQSNRMFICAINNISRFCFTKPM